MTRLRLLFVGLVVGLLLPATTLSAQTSDLPYSDWLLERLLVEPQPVLLEWSSAFGGELTDNPDDRIEITGITRTTSTFPPAEGLNETQRDVVRRLLQAFVGPPDPLGPIQVEMIHAGSIEYLLGRPTLDATVIDLDRPVASCTAGQFWEVGIAVEIGGFPAFGADSGLPNFVEGFTNVITVTCENGTAATAAALASEDGSATPATSPLPTFIMATPDRNAVAFLHPYSESLTLTVAGFVDTGANPPPNPYAMVSDPIPPGELLPFAIPQLTDEQLAVIRSVLGDTVDTQLDGDQSGTNDEVAATAEADNADVADEGVATGDPDAGDDVAVADVEAGTDDGVLDVADGGEVTDGGVASGVDGTAESGGVDDGTDGAADIEESEPEPESEEQSAGDQAGVQPEDVLADEAANEGSAADDAEGAANDSDVADVADVEQPDTNATESNENSDGDSGSALGIVLAAGAGGAALLAAIAVVRKKSGEREWEARGAEELPPMEIDADDARNENRRAALQYLNAVVTTTLENGGVVDDHGILEIPHSVLEAAAPTPPNDSSLRRDDASNWPGGQIVSAAMDLLPETVTVLGNDGEDVHLGVRVDALRDVGPGSGNKPPIESNEATLESGTGEVAPS